MPPRGHHSQYYFIWKHTTRSSRRLDYMGRKAKDGKKLPKEIKKTDVYAELAKSQAKLAALLKQAND